MTIEAVLFDLDGVLIDSEPVWEEVRREVVADHGGQWQPDSQRRLMGMSTQEWSRYLAQDLGVDMPPQDVAELVIGRMEERYDDHLPLIRGAVEAVERCADRWPLGLASSSPERLIRVALEQAGIHKLFTHTLSSEQVARGKPAPDVYLEVADRLGVAPASCAVIEDSTNGMRAAKAAGMWLVAIPRPRYPPEADALAAADIVLFGLRQLTAEAIESLG
ncbi:MAG TPA: HAD family phosphatase [Candidatus Dormibacteraeota bacterium]|jgi:HAD superfamily hydrolase (TIGR01509 family)|nr:HAD family phosphatase [Candidatus Dormibacteraeota bacterium]